MSMIIKFNVSIASNAIPITSTVALDSSADLVEPGTLQNDNKSNLLVLSLSDNQIRRNDNVYETFMTVH